MRPKSIKLGKKYRKFEQKQQISEINATKSFAYLYVAAQTDNLPSHAYTYIYLYTCMRVYIYIYKSAGKLLPTRR